MTVITSTLLDTFDNESFDRRLPGAQGLGALTATRRIGNRTVRVITRDWQNAPPGILRGLQRHYEDHGTAPHALTLRTGEELHALYVQAPQITQRPGGFGTARVTFEELLAWD